ncbi:hypothetical protein ABIE21_002440 [Conyzicola nivalis]|uniref:Uncharacterized protein n=1 Tax=Conyzicola nivalis TaxID=1477021 RepID=A0ABV2QQT2_9MICO
MKHLTYSEKSLLVSDEAIEYMRGKLQDLAFPPHAQPEPHHESHYAGDDYQLG